MLNLFDNPKHICSFFLCVFLWTQSNSFFCWSEPADDIYIDISSSDNTSLEDKPLITPFGMKKKPTCFQMARKGMCNAYKVLTGISIPLTYVTVYCLSIKHNGLTQTIDFYPGMFAKGKLGLFLGSFITVTFSNGVVSCVNGLSGYYKLLTACRRNPKGTCRKLNSVLSIDE